MEADVVCAAPCRTELGEGPVWDHARGLLWWVDIAGRRLQALDPVRDAEPRSWDLPMRPTAVAPRKDRSLLMATDKGVGVFDPDTGMFELKLDLEPNRPCNRPNDGKVDLEGRFWIGTMDDAEKARSGALYRIDPDWTATRVLDDVRISNTVSVGPDGRTFYFADSGEKTLYVHDILDDGTLSAPQVFAHTRDTDMAPDGSAVDEEGCLWNCQWGGRRVVRYAPDGTIDRIVALPVDQPASCAFGGADFTTLYVTTARVGLSPERLEAQPLAGALFAVETGVRGLELPPFAG